MTKMDMIWISVATLIYPKTNSSSLVSFDEIIQEVSKLFDENKITPAMVQVHLVSWEERRADRTNPQRGGSRNRYLFKTKDGRLPSVGGKFRLYKVSDCNHDGIDKDGKTHPSLEDVDNAYHYLIDWYENEYFGHE